MVDFHGKRVYPVIVAPMGAVTDENNYKIWLENNFLCVVPRTVDFEKRLEISKETFASFSLNEAKSLVNLWAPKDSGKHFICIDIAHGTMRQLYDVCSDLKKLMGDDIVIMTGNVANPEAYHYYARNGIDFMRACIGTGSRCVIEGTKIRMADGAEKPIEKVVIGDFVLTRNGSKRVINTFSKIACRYVTINNKITTTPNHKFYTDDGWIEAYKLSETANIFNDQAGKERVESLLISLSEKGKNFYDIEVEDEHEYFANGFLVHNCTTSCNVGVHYPTGTLIDGLRMKKDDWADYHEKATEIIVDGGISNFDDIQKCIALGAWGVMSGSIFAKAQEACEPIVFLNPNNLNMADAIPAEEYYEKLAELKERSSVFENDDNEYWSAYKKLSQRKPYRSYWGMSTRKAQKATGGSGKTTAEGIERPIPVEYPIAKWADNMASYMRSCMSYTGCRTIKEMREETELIVNLSGDRSFRK
jgi:IMP dehydrogenase/GMP reductase